MTGNTSEQSGSVEEVSLWPTDPDVGITFLCQRYIGSMLTAIISAIAFLSPLAMVVLPKIGNNFFLTYCIVKKCFLNLGMGFLSSPSEFNVGSSSVLKSRC